MRQATAIYARASSRRPAFIPSRLLDLIDASLLAGVPTPPTRCVPEKGATSDLALRSHRGPGSSSDGSFLGFFLFLYFPLHHSNAPDAVKRRDSSLAALFSSPPSTHRLHLAVITRLHAPGPLRPLIGGDLTAGGGTYRRG